MKRAWMIPLAFAVGCSSGPEESSAPAPAPMPAPRAGGAREAQLSSLRAQLASKKADLAQADADLARIGSERAQLEDQPASNTKTSRMAELATLEAENKRKRQAVTLDITDLENQIRDVGKGAKTADQDDLASALEADAEAEKERVARRKAAEEAARSDESRKVAAAESARKAEEDERAKQKVEGGRAAPAGADGPIFEERWADAIIKLREAIQEFKRW
jgi:chromosome segregation ATPase